MKPRLLAILVLIAMMAVAFAGCGEDGGSEEAEEEEKLNCWYTIEIENPDSISYVVTVPTVVDSKRSILGEFHHRKAVGSASSASMETEFGPALEITARNDLILEHTDFFELNQSNRIHLSMLNVTQFESWKAKIHYHSDQNISISIKISLSIRHEDGFESWKIKGSLSNGWQELDCNYSVILEENR